jgi:hypothetical protein
MQDRTRALLSGFFDFAVVLGLITFAVVVIL